MIIADYTVIADVGRTIQKLLIEHMTPEPISQAENIGLSPPTESGDLNLSLFLYNIKENGDNRNNQMISRGVDALQYPPMTVDLHYLLTAHSSAELQTRAFDEHRILGRAMQVLYDHSILRNSVLQGSLADENEEIRVTMNEAPLDTMINLFSESTYKLSVSYVIGPVFINSTRIKTTKRVLDRDFNIQG